jgi:hypothetical protein
MIPNELGERKINFAFCRAVKLCAESGGFCPPQQRLRGVEIVHHGRKQRILAREVLDRPSWPMPHAIDEGDLTSPSHLIS